MTRIAYHFGIVCLLRKGFPLPPHDETLSLSGDSLRLPKAYETPLVSFNIELAWDSYHPFMPFKVHYFPAHVVIEFTNIVVALRLIAAFILWVWLYVIALLLSHYNGPLYFN